jgi:integrase
MKSRTSERITLQEFNRLIENLSHSTKKTDQKIRIILLLQYYTSLRYSDCKQITFNDVLNNNTIRLVEKKTSKTKEITINPKLKDVVKVFYEINTPQINYSIASVSLQYVNKKLNEYRYVYNIKTRSDDRIKHFSTHSIRKCSLYEIYKRSGINVSLAISNHDSIKVHLRYISETKDIINGYLSL